MAIASTAQWDVRTTGSDANGGAFDPGVGSPGTDYSQQNSAEIAFTDLVIGATTTQLTSVANPFGSAHVGNVISIASGTGFTVGRYEILSVSGTTATMDRSVGTAASTGGTGNLGGSMLTPVTAINAASSGNTVWIEAGTYTETTAATINNSSFSGSAYLSITGYGVTHGDNGTAPLWTTATNSIDLINVQTTSTDVLYSFTNISFSSTAATKANGIQSNTGGPGNYLYVQNCTLTGFLNAINGDNAYPSHGIWYTVTIAGTEIANSTGVAVSTGAGNNFLLYISGSYIHGGSSDGIYSLERAVIVNSIIANNAGYGINAANSVTHAVLMGNTFADNTSGGVAMTGIGVDSALILENNIFYGNGGYGFSNTGTSAVWPFPNDHNAYGDNTSGARHGIPAGTGDITLSASPFTNTSAGDYSLNTSAGGGVALNGAGFPGAFGGGASNGYLSVGAVQPKASSGGGGGGSFTFVA